MTNKKWGDWQIIEEIDGGGQGTVYKVRHSDNRLGALKRLKNPKRLDRFKKEVEAVATLKHPNIVPLFDANTTVEPYYAVFEYEHGGCLADLSPDELRAVPLTVRIQWCLDIAEALTVAHGKSMIHRDVKPDNILLSPDKSSARLCDFGLVYMEDDERVTASMEQVGSRYFIPPECEDGRADQVSPASDLYSLGKVLYYVTSGGKIFARERHREPDCDLSQLVDNPYVEAISLVLDQTVTSEVSDRYTSSQDFATSLNLVRQKIFEQLPVAGVFDTYRCMFCGEGKYTEVCISRTGHNEGYKEGNVSREHMVFMECDICGNCQRFKLKYAGEKWFPRAHAEWKTRP